MNEPKAVGKEAKAVWNHLAKNHSKSELMMIEMIKV